MSKVRWTECRTRPGFFEAFQKGRVRQDTTTHETRPLLGDQIESFLSSIGITSDRVSGWLGRPCGCKERREKLNQFDAWKRRVIAGKVENARRHLLRLMGSSEDIKDDTLDEKDSDD